ncbi:hypothetical protein H5410_021239 [Solanum commersonii]|uniref:Transposase MuDR plant domain-containing protein n=1 Tax=Solanum commersonii TaxID=4109 RepID=A0A9J5ZGK4_SOLCO|nr:hypothetical protein H5410_021239 [Solanum commersonii]
MTSFEHNVMVALYWGGEIITDMNGFRYTECARMIISMSTSTNYVELVGLLHEKMRTNSENIHMDISGKYPCSIQVSGHHGYHINLLAQNYGFTMANQPHFVEPVVQPPFQQLSMHGHRSFGEGSSSQMHIDNSHRDYEARDNETNIDLYNDVNAEISDESSEEDEPPKDGDESEPDEDIDDIRDFSQNGVNLHNHKQGVSEIQNHDIPYFRTLENGEDIFMSTCESEMEYCSIWSEEAKKDLKKGMFFSSKEKLKRVVTIWSLHKNKEFNVVTSTKSLWVVRCKFYSLLGCLWFLRGRKVGDNLWKIGKYVENHRCETEGLSSGHANLNTNLIASLFLNQIRKNPKYLVVDVISKVHEKFGHQVTYRKAWLGRQRAFELELRQYQEPRAFHRFCISHLKSNFQSKFPNKDLSRLMWRAASAHQVRKFESLMWQIREENVEAHEYLMEIPLDKWTLAMMVEKDGEC